MDEEEYNRFKKYDIGDIVGVRGEVFRTQRGEMSVRDVYKRQVFRPRGSPARRASRPW